MNLDLLLSLVRDPAKTADVSALELEELVREFPHFTAAQMLLLKLYKSQNSSKFNRQLRVVTTLAPDRRVVYQLVEAQAEPKELLQLEASGNGHSVEITAKAKEDIAAEAVAIDPVEEAVPWSDEPISTVEPAAAETSTMPAEEVSLSASTTETATLEADREAISEAEEAAPAVEDLSTEESLAATVASTEMEEPPVDESTAVMPEVLEPTGRSVEESTEDATAESEAASENIELPVMEVEEVLATSDAAEVWQLQALEENSSEMEVSKETADSEEAFESTLEALSEVVADAAAQLPVAPELYGFEEVEEVDSAEVQKVALHDSTLAAAPGDDMVLETPQQEEVEIPEVTQVLKPEEERAPAVDYPAAAEVAYVPASSAVAAALAAPSFEIKVPPVADTTESTEVDRETFIARPHDRLTWFRFFAGKSLRDEPEEVLEQLYMEHMQQDLLQAPTELEEISTVRAKINHEEEVPSSKELEAEIRRLAYESISDDELPASETLAGIYASQNDFKRAIRIYQKLILKFPDKMSYFAGLIAELKAKQSN